MITPEAFEHWSRLVGEMTDGELNELNANMLTCFLQDLAPPTTAEQEEFRRMLVRIRDENLDRYQRSEHHSAEPRGQG
jgi:hypothetical protein